MEEGHRTDPYREDAKLPEGTTCPDCHATVAQGRWTWNTAAADAPEQRCPACRRIQDGVPAGKLTLSGDFLRGHGSEILNLLTNTEQRLREAHPLERMIDVDGAPSDGEVVMTFTGTHITHGMANALQHAFEGTMEAPYTEGGTLLQIHWKR
jgi:hypothetical protein